MAKKRPSALATVPVNYAKIGASLFNVPPLPIDPTIPGAVVGSGVALAASTVEATFGDPVIVPQQRAARQVDSDTLVNPGSGRALDAFSQFVAALLSRYAYMADGSVMAAGMKDLLGFAKYTRKTTAANTIDIWYTPGGVGLIAFRGEDNKVFTACPAADPNDLEGAAWGAGVVMTAAPDGNYVVDSLYTKASDAASAVASAVPFANNPDASSYVFVGYGAGGVAAWHAAKVINAAVGSPDKGYPVSRVITVSEWPFFNSGADSLDAYYKAEHARVLHESDPVRGVLSASVMLNNLGRILKGSTDLIDYRVPDYAYGDTEMLSKSSTKRNNPSDEINSTARRMISYIRLYGLRPNPPKGRFAMLGNSDEQKRILLARQDVADMIAAAGGKDGNGPLGFRGEYGPRGYCLLLEAAAKSSGSTPYPLFTRAVAVSRMLDELLKDA